MNVIAILCSDIHLSLKAPIARSAEENWFDAMKRPLDEIKDLAKKHNAIVICAGDVFDKPINTSEIINFALDNLPDNMFGIPGQHDLPSHRYDEIEKSSYWTLVLAGKIRNLNPKNRFGIQRGKLVVYGFPWGLKIKPLKEEYKICEGYINLAVVHKYIWKIGYSYPGADDDCRVANIYQDLEGYDAAVFGDNHQGFLNNPKHILPIFNAGTLMRRKIDEISYRPQVGLLYEDGSIKPHYLDTSKDKFIDVDEAKQKEQQELDTTAFLKELKGLGSDSLDFRDTVYRYMDSKKIDSDVRELVLESIE